MPRPAAPSPAGPASAGPAAPGSPSAAEVYELLVRGGPRARTDLAARLGLSGPTLTRLAREMLDAGLLRELAPRGGGPGGTSKGRPQRPLDVDEDHARFVGVKITATDVYAAVVDVRGQEVQEVHAALPDGGPGTVLGTVVELCGPLVAGRPEVAGVGVGIGAQVEDRVVVSSTLLDWPAGVPVGSLLEARLGLPVSVGNDFHALLEGLAWTGTGTGNGGGHRSFAVLTIGAGVGVGTVLEGEVLRGRRRLAGVTGSLPTITRDGRGVLLRTVASTAHVLAAARDRGVPLPAGEGPAAALEAVLAAAAAGDPGARDVVEDTAHAVAVAAAGLVGVLDTEAVVLGGEAVGLLRASEHFDDVLRRHLSRVMRDVEVRLLPDDFDAWARGAAVLAVRRFIGGHGPA